VAAELEGYGPEAFDQTIEYSDPSPDNKARAHSRAIYFPVRRSFSSVGLYTGTA
jgi:hypothetical protein